jgi:hypothetical protein
MLIGGILGGEQMAVHLAGIGCLAGYPIWLRARLRALRDGKPFHLGSVVNVIVCTIIAIGFGLASAFSDFLSNGPFVGMTLAVTAAALWLHWHFARTVKLLPSAGEIGHEIVGAIFADDMGIAALHAVVDVGKEAVKDLRRKEP